MTSPDQAIRQRALDPACSFCVTAPAGSGKTELLTQRILVLLARVARPEQVLAITFTRKAAAEMRERLAGALNDARVSKPVDSEHQRTTRQLAEAVLEHGARQGWPVDDPEIFNIRTIDSFCHYLTRQMPLLSGLGGNMTPADDALPLYEAAVDALFEQGFSDPLTAEALSALLLSFDNDWLRLRELLVRLLQRRGDWAHRFLDTDDAATAEATLKQAVTRLIEDHLAALKSALGPGRVETLRDIVAGAARTLRELSEAEALGKHPLPPGPESPALAATLADLADWQWAAGLLLTKDAKPKLRSRLDKNCGFPPDAKARKADAQAFLARLADESTLIEQLDELRHLPRVAIGDRSWQLVLQLAHLLPRLEAHLLLTFKAFGSVDHVHIALAAEHALGDDDNPTDLALRLDYQLEHILIDEFQDTSDSQYRLLERLTRDWASHNATGSAPRTVFLVGDGMQSIYRFRSANVGLFVRARDQGIGGLSLEPLSLTSNFRSQATLVEWVNRHFRRLLPERDDPARGLIRHAHADPVKPPIPGEPVEVHLFSAQKGVAEANWLCTNIARLRQAEPEASIAVLGRGRAHLAPVAKALQSAGIPMVGRDLQPLAMSPVIGDLMSLCRWLANPADSIAAVALLRAPFTGLTIADMTRLLAGTPAPIVLREMLLNADRQLDGDALARCELLREALSWAEGSRDRLALPIWVEQIWLRLGGPGAVDPIQWSDARQFFDVLTDAEASGIGIDPEGLQRLLEKRYVDHEVADNPVELLTLHKSKGLQFDYVFIPGLANAVRSDGRELLRWHSHQTRQGRELLIAADDGSEAGDSSLYQYLSWMDRSKSAAERCRLLYVGITRARNKVWLSGEVSDVSAWESGKANDSLLGLLVGDNEVPPVLHAEDGSDTVEMTTPPLWRRQWPKFEVAERGKKGGGSPPPMPRGRGNLAERAAGTALHRALELLSRQRPLPVHADAATERAVALVLMTAVHDPQALERLKTQVLEDVDRVLADDTGRWLLGDHPVADSELPLIDSTEGGREFIVDRTFIDEDAVRWIVDYKSARPAPDTSLPDFMAAEISRYQSQLERYAALLAQLDAQQRPGRVSAYRVALYFPALGQWTVLTPEVAVSKTDQAP